MPSDVRTTAHPPREPPSGFQGLFPFLFPFFLSFFARRFAMNLNTPNGFAQHATETASDTTRALRDSVDTLQSQTSSALTRAAAQAEALSREGLERARRATEAARAQAQRVGDQTVGYIKDEPVKAVAIAAGVGAVAALLVGWLARSKRSPHGLR